MSTGDDPTLASPPPEPERGGGSGDDGDSDGDGEDRDRRRLMVALGAAGALVLLLLIALVVVLVSGDGDDSDVSTAATSTSSSTSTSTTSTTVAPPTTSPTTKPAPPATPSVQNLTVNPNFVACYQNTTKDVTVSWSSQNATQTVLSVDGPGAYGTYGPSGSQMLNVQCESTTHHYTVTAKGPGGQGTANASLQVTVIPGPPPP